MCVGVSVSVFVRKSEGKRKERGGGGKSEGWG